MGRIGTIKDVKAGEYFIAQKPLSYGWQWDSGLGGYAETPLKLQDEGFYTLKGILVLRIARLPASCNKQLLKIFEDQTEIGTIYLFDSAGKINDHTGTDPEIFVTHGKTRKTLLPAFKFLPEQSKAPKLATYTNYGFKAGLKATVYRDGFAAEMSTSAIHCHAYLVDHIREGLQKVLAAAQKIDPTSQLTIRNTFPIPKATMAMGTDDEVALGCNPSFNAYDDAPKLPANARKFPMRFAGGHVHFGGVSNQPKEKLIEMVKTCDILSAIPGVAIFASVDTPLRRQYYGRAGEYRLPKHGLEYRTLSNAWLATPAVAHLMLNLTRIGTKVGCAGLRKHLNIDEDRAREIVNFCDVKAARGYLKDKYEIISKLLYNDSAGDNVKALKKIIEGGVEAAFPDFENIPENWYFNKPWATHSGNPLATWGAACAKI